MLGSIVDHVASLAKGREVGVRVVRGVVVLMSSGQHHLSPAGPSEDVSFYSDPDPPAPAVTPPASICVPPATVAEVVDCPPMRSPAALAAASRAPEPDYGRELRPVDGVEEAVLGPDRHEVHFATGREESVAAEECY